MHYKVVRAVLWVDGVKKRRGDVVEMLPAEAEKYGVGLDVLPYVKPTVTRKKRAYKRASEV